MLQRVMIDGIELPRLYIAENIKDAQVASAKGIPYIRWTQGQEALIKMLLRPVLEEMFPHIKWSSVLGPRRKFRTKVVICDSVNDINADVNDDVIDPEWAPNDTDVTEINNDTIAYDNETLSELASVTNEERLFSNNQRKMVNMNTLSIEEYIGDMSSYVNIEMLQRLRLMPMFIGNIIDCVKVNLSSGVHWSEGYNKRLGLAVGRYNASPQLPNLVVLDVSGSIPRGISATMISLIDTLRTQLSADLIITGSISRYYAAGDQLPNPDRIRASFGYGNEDFDFFNILANHIKGRKIGHVFSFGDYDTPWYERMKPESLAGTSVRYVHHYHTHSETKTGYAKWCHMLADEPEVEYCTDWCDVIYS